jgi:iron complex outermembrane receptor protein
MALVGKFMRRRLEVLIPINFFVVDMKIHYNATPNFSFDFGIDNLFNEQYFLFHPFPGRTFVLAAKYAL